MKILITNDDGIAGYGISVLTQTFARAGAVYVAAPAQNQSGVGHGLTVTVPLRAKPYDMPGATEAWAINGTPADCIKLSLEQLLPVRPDIVVSGINNGPNLATDVIYSGTVAGALEGFFHGLPAIAVSVMNRIRHSDFGNYQLAAEIALEYSQKIINGDLPRTVLNINVPGDTPEEVKGVRFAALGWRWYDNAYEKRIDPQGKPYYWLQGQIVDRAADGKTDVEICGKGYAVVTPLHFDLTDYSLLDRLAADQPPCGREHQAAKQSR